MLQTIERLWNITEALNVLYKENWTVMANMEMIKFQGEMVTALRDEMAEDSCSRARDGEGEDFSLTTAFFYCLSLATTVGYEGGVPHTPLGKLVSVGIACIGLPIFLLYICLVGGTLARRFQVLPHLHHTRCRYMYQMIENLW